MKEITVTLYPEDTGNHDYTDCGKCPIASALKSSGFMFPTVGPNWWGAWKLVWWPPFIWHSSGPIPHDINKRAMYLWAKARHTQPITFNLPVG